MVQPRLVNGPFDDPGLLLDFRHGRRAVLFDCGDLTNLSARELVRVSHVFVSHLHMDHFAGFDRLLRTNLYQPRTVFLAGPPGLVDAVEHKLSAYIWNLLGPDSVDFSIVAADWDNRFHAAARFSARNRFKRQQIPVPDAPDAGLGALLNEEDFAVEAVTLDHGIPCLAFALQERLQCDAAIAASKCHLTAAQAGAIVRAAGAPRATAFHFSARYLEDEDGLRAEFTAAIAGALDVAPPELPESTGRR